MKSVACYSLDDELIIYGRGSDIYIQHFEYRMPEVFFIRKEAVPQIIKFIDGDKRHELVQTNGQWLCLCKWPPPSKDRTVHVQPIDPEVDQGQWYLEIEEHRDSVEHGPTIHIWHKYLEDFKCIITELSK